MGVVIAPVLVMGLMAVMDLCGQGHGARHGNGHRHGCPALKRQAHHEQQQQSLAQAVHHAVEAITIGRLALLTGSSRSPPSAARGR